MSILISNLRLSLNWDSDIGFGQLEIFKDDDGNYFANNEAINKACILHILKELVNDFEQSDIKLDIENNTTHNIFLNKMSPRIPGLYVAINKNTTERIYIIRNGNTYEHHGVFFVKNDNIEILPVHGFSTFDEIYNKSIKSSDYVKTFLGEF